MSDPDKIPQPAKPALAFRVDEMREKLRQVPAKALAERTGSKFQAHDSDRGEFRFILINSALRVSYPDFQTFDAQNNELPPFIQAMVMYYFDSESGLPVSGKWISFAELPDGRVYNSAFQRNSGDVLVKFFGEDIEALRNACEKLGGLAIDGFGDAAYVIQALPRVPLLVNYWLGDEDFSSSAKILFDETVSHYLPTEACAILGNILARKLVNK